jgi:hypothetical protein
MSAFPTNVGSVSSGSGKFNSAADTADIFLDAMSCEISRTLPALWLATTSVGPMLRRFIL